MGFLRLPRRVPLHLHIEAPVRDDAIRRVQRFGGFVQSGAPLPELRILVNGVEQPFARYDLGDPTAVADRRFTAYWNFHRETETICDRHDRIVFDLFAGRRHLGHRSFRFQGPDDKKDQPLFYIIHIPKTAGTSFRNALENQPAIRHISVYDNFNFMSPDDCTKLTSHAFDDLDVVFGHFQYGLHRHFSRKYEYITIVRNPVDMIISAYLHMKYIVQAPEYLLYESLDEAVVANLGLYDNTMTRLLSGKTAGERVCDADFTVALENLARDFCYVGTVETMQESLEVIAARLGAPLSLFRDNATPKDREIALYDRSQIVDKHYSLLRYDLQIYDHVSKAFAREA